MTPPQPGNILIGFPQLAQILKYVVVFVMLFYVPATVHVLPSPSCRVIWVPKSMIWAPRQGYLHPNLWFGIPVYELGTGCDLGTQARVLSASRERQMSIN